MKINENKTLLYFKTRVLVVFVIHFDFFHMLIYSLYSIGTYKDNEAFSHKLSHVNIILTKVLSFWQQ